MGVVKLILFRRTGRIKHRNTTYSVPESSLVVADADAVPAGGNSHDWQAYVFNAGEMQALYADVMDLLGKNVAAPFFKQPVKQLEVSAETMRAIQYLGEMDQRAMLRFVYSYCLGLDREYFSRLLHHFIDGSREFFEYVERNSLNAWPVSQYAEELGISVRKLNMLFYEKCGVSAKHWLLERRLKKARELLLATSMKVTDVAQECGFNSHAHFSDSFKRRYNECPRGLRRKGDMNSVLNEEDR